MKNKILFLLLMISTALSWSLEAEAQTTNYVLNESTEYTLKTASGIVHTYDNIATPNVGEVTFEAKTSMATTSNAKNITVQYTTNGSSWTNAGTVSLSTSYNSYSVKGINSNATGIRFNVGGIYTRSVKNVKIARATTLSTSSSSLDFGNVKYGESSNNTINVTYNNTYSGAVLTGKCTNPAFTVTRANMGETGTTGITITYNANTLGQQTGTVTLTMGTDGKNNNVTTTLTVSGTGVIDYNYSANTGVNRDAFGTASVAFDGGAAGTTAKSSVQNTTESSVGKTASFSAAANTGYEFVGWGTSANATSYESTANPYNYTMTATLSAPLQSKTLYAIFKPVFKFSASATSSNETLGTATASVTNNILGDVDATQAETTATFTATPADTCVFKGWYETSTYEGEPVSTNANYDVTLTNSTIGSTTTKSLYALFKKKQNLQWADTELDLNLVNGHDYSTAATVTSGKTITYTTDNAQAVTIDNDGTIHAVGLGDAHVTASVEGNDIYQPETITRDFSVGEIKQATFTPAWGEGTSTDIKVDGSTSIGLLNIANDATFTIAVGTPGIINVNRDGNTLNIAALTAGTTTLTLTQTGNASLAGNQVTYTITVSKYPNTFALADETKAMKVDDVWEGVITNQGNDNTQVSYSVEGVATYDAEHNKITAIAEGTTAITFTQAATDRNEGITKTINVTVTKVVNTLSVTLANTDVDVDGTINLVVAGRISDGATHAYISDVQLSSEVNKGTDVITYANNVITACNAGTAKIKFTQDATAKYTAYESETYTITVNKLSNAITVTLDGEQKNSKNVGRGATVTMSLASTSGVTDYQFTRISGTDDIATINSTSIVSGQTDGTSIWEISQPETYKYAAATTTVRVKVNSVPEEEGYVLNENQEYSHGTGEGVTHTYTLSGPGETLTYSARTQSAAIYYHLYVQYSIDGSNWVNAQDNQNLGSSYRDYTCTIPEEAKYVRFYFPSGGTLTKYVKNVKVTRKTYVRATASQTNLGEVYTDKTASATFNVNYSSTNGGDIDIMSSNTRFAVDKHTISVDNNSDNVSDPVVVTVTYTPDPDHLGDDEGTITVSDRYYSAELTFTAFAKKYPTTISRGSNTATETTVDGTIDNAFAFTGTTTSVPTANSDDDFYYTIASTYTSDVHNEDGVITYDPATNTVTGRNAGTARLTIYQKSTNLYAATSQTFDFSVSKLANPVNIALSTTTIEVDGTATVALTNDDGKGAVSVAFSNIAYTNESQNREGGFLAYDADAMTLTGVNAGTATVTVTQQETYKYLPKSQQFTVTVNKLVQTLTWDNPDLETALQKNAVVTGNGATSNVGLTPVTYASGNTSAIEVDPENGDLRAVNTGSNIAITASQAGNYKYAPANISRNFSVFNKQTPTFAGDAHFSGSIATIDWEGTAIITVTGVGADADAGFTISGYDSEIINVGTTPIDNGYTVTLTGLKIGETTLTITQAASDDFIAKSQTYTVNVVWPEDYLTLDVATAPTHSAGTYRKVFFNRTLKSGYNSIALPFDYALSDLNADWAAQLSVVTYNAKDGYSLYFKKITEGTLNANEPYIIHLTAQKEDPQFSDVTVEVASVIDKQATGGVNADGHSYRNWSMHSNYTPALDMNGKYGVVNADNCLKLGGAGSTLSAFTAYITGPANTRAQVKAAYIDDEEANGILEALMGEQEPKEVYDLQGRRLPSTQRGINIIRQSDGSVKKIMK